MPDVNILAVLAAAISVFVIGFTYYAGRRDPREHALEARDHAGDWLVKLLVVAVIVSVWR